MESLDQNTAEKLQLELALRGKYYFKGFGSCLQNLILDLETLTEPGSAEDARQRLSTMVSIYQSIPFKKIINHPDYDLLLQIKEAIQTLIPKLEKFLNREEENIDEIWQIIKFISEKGEEYRARLVTLLNQLNAQPGHEKDGFKVIDIDGKAWDYPF